MWIVLHVCCPGSLFQVGDTKEKDYKEADKDFYFSLITFVV